MISDMKLYGFTKILDFPCVCWGRRGVFFKLKYVKGSRRFKWYYGKVTSEDVLRNFFNNNGHRFFGLVVKEDI